MAAYRFSAQTIKRSEGRSACAAAAYRSASRIICERTGSTHDYTRRHGVLHAEIMLPENAPDWMADRIQLWNAVEAVEKRINSQLAREVQLNLPHELDDTQRHDLVLSFVREQFVDQGMIADIAIHGPDGRGDERNHHAHIMLTMRALTADGFAKKKERSWNDKALLPEWREQWALHQNRALERAGHEARVDHRSLADQGIDREPEPKLGPVATKMERDGRTSHAGDDLRAVWQRNAERAAREEKCKVLDLEVERERLRLLEEHHHAARGQEDDGYARAKPAKPVSTRPEPVKHDREAEARIEERDRQQAALEGLRAKVKALEASLEGRNGLAVFIDKLRGRVGWKAERELSNGRNQLAELERAQAIENAKQRRLDRRDSQFREAPERDQDDPVAARRARDREDDPPERLTIKAEDAFRRGDVQDAPPGGVVDFEAAKEAALQARLERRREIIEQVQNRDERDGPDRER